MRRRSSLCGARAKATKKTSRPRAPRDPQKAKEATKRFYNARPRWKDFAFPTKAGIRKGLPAFAKAKGDSLPPHSAKPIWIPAFAGKGEWVAQKQRGRQSLGEGDNRSELGGNRPMPDGERSGGITTKIFPSACSKRRLRRRGLLCRLRPSAGSDFLRFPASNRPKTPPHCAWRNARA